MLWGEALELYLVALVAHLLRPCATTYAIHFAWLRPAPNTVLSASYYSRFFRYLRRRRVTSGTALGAPRCPLGAPSVPLGGERPWRRLPCRVCLAAPRPSPEAVLRGKRACATLEELAQCLLGARSLLGACLPCAPACLPAVYGCLFACARWLAAALLTSTSHARLSCRLGSSFDAAVL